MHNNLMFVFPFVLARRASVMGWSVNDRPRSVNGIIPVNRVTSIHRNVNHPNWWRIEVYLYSRSNGDRGIHRRGQIHY